MKKERTILKISTLEANNGQIPWLPTNPRQWTQTDIDKTRDSVLRDPDFLEDRPLLVIPLEEKKWVVFAGNLRREGAKAGKVKEVSAVIYYPETEEDKQTIKRRAILDNGSFGAWDYDALANEWDDLPLTEWGVPAWEENQDDEMPTELDAETEDKDFILKITFPDSDKMTAFIMAYKDILEQDYDCIMSESGGRV